MTNLFVFTRSSVSSLLIVDVKRDGVCLPAQTFLVFAVDLTRFLQFRLKLVDGVLFGVHVHDEGVGWHF